MRAQLYRWLMPIGVAASMLLGSCTIAAAQPVRDHRGPRQDRPPPDSGPREAPPPPREERREAQRAGFVWVSGEWDWRGGRYEWIPGHWERERGRKRWRDTRWEARGGVWVKVGGDWIDDDNRPGGPNQAPPPPRDERFENRRGFVWVPGYWDWQNGSYIWVAGRYEKERRGKRWRSVRWELRNGVWVKVDGSWDDDRGGGGPAQCGPTPPTSSPPPGALKPETIRTPPGTFEIKGHWAWENCQYIWVSGRAEPVRPGFTWKPGNWNQVSGGWAWHEGQWLSSCTENPPLNNPPPGAPKPETIRTPPGTFEVKGHWAWQNCQYVWVPGYAERDRPGFYWKPGDWNQRSGHWYWTDGRWIDRGGGSPPPPPPPRGGGGPPPPPPPGGGPTSPPPPPQAEKWEPRAGFLWARGHWEWRTDKYEWIPGHWERERARATWYEAKWELRDGRWVFIPEGWK